MKFLYTYKPFLQRLTMIKEYYRANSLNDAYEHTQNGFVILAGGGYISKHQEEINSVVDIQKIGLYGIENESGFLSIGANEKLQTILENSMTPDSLKKAIQRFPGSLNIRNSASIAGASLVADGKFDILPWLLVAGTKIEIFPNDRAVLLKDYLEEYKREKNIGIITKFLIPTTSRINYEVISRSPNDGILVGVFVNQPKDSRETLVCVSGYDLYPICFVLNEEGDERKEELKQYFKNAHSQYNNQFCSFSYFKAMVIELFERLTRE